MAHSPRLIQAGTMAQSRALIAVIGFLLSAVAVADDRPNFLIIVADDLGYSDLGAFGGEIQTTVLDELATAGVRLTNFHTAPACSPTRAMLLTGLDNHEAGLGAMAEARSPNQIGHAGYEGYLRHDNATLAELLQAHGYRTHFSGKWHLGSSPDQLPHRRGFESSFVLVQGMHNHFGQDLSGEGVGRPPTYLDNGRPVTQLQDNFYSSDEFTTKLLEQFDHARKDTGQSKPFFAYLAFTAPHWPLHAPRHIIDRYRGKYDQGYDVLRTQRLHRLKTLGLVAADIAPSANDLAPAWSSLSMQERARSARRMEVYAAMVERLDENVGRVVTALRASGELDNTYILFLSDNGAEAADVTALPPTAVEFLGIANADNRVDNIGSPTSFDSIGPGWAGASTAPFWRVKAYQGEGGTRVAAFLTGPFTGPQIRSTYVNVMDVVPTFLDLAQVTLPQGTFQGRSVRALRGRSWMPWLRGEAPSVYRADDPVGSELFGGRSLRQGDWKLLDIGDGRWRLFNTVADPGETHDLADREPQRLHNMINAWDTYAQEVDVVLPDQLMPIINRPSARQ